MIRDLINLHNIFVLPYKTEAAIKNVSVSDKRPTYKNCITHETRTQYTARDTGNG